jgi:hypothetical protein
MMRKISNPASRFVGLRANMPGRALGTRAAMSWVSRAGLQRWNCCRIGDPCGQRMSRANRARAQMRTASEYVQEPRARVVAMPLMIALRVRELPVAAGFLARDFPATGATAPQLGMSGRPGANPWR